MVSKPEIMGRKILARTLSRDQDHGGILSEITGAQGTAKTSILLSFTKHTIQERPEERIFWREQLDAPLQTFKLGLDYIEFFIKKGSGTIFRDRNRQLKKVELPAQYFDTYEELYDLSSPGKASVVFFDSDAEWMNFIHHLRGVGQWVNIFIDEMADIAPAINSGNMFQKINKFANDMGAVRRCMMNCFYNTQTAADVDWKIRKKVMLKIFLPGATTDKYSRVSQKAIDNLIRDPVNGNQAYLDIGGEFGKVQFSDIFKPNHKLHIEAHRIKQKKDEDGK